MSLNKAIVGFVNHKLAEGLSPRTIYSYRRDLELWLTYQDDVDIREVTSRDLRDYLNFNVVFHHI
ncbi:site-specific integrase [Chloroflexota bacterium]